MIDPARIVTSEKLRLPAGKLSERLPAAIGLAILLLAAGAMLAWIVRAPGILQPDTSPAMVFNTALCLALTALAIILNKPVSRRTIVAQQSLGGIVILIAGLVLSQYWFGYSLGIDWAALHDWIVDDNPYPGRMSKMTSAAFLLCGTVLVLMHWVRNLWTGLLVQTLTVAIAAVGVAGLAGLFLELRFVYPDYLFGQMSAQTAAGFVASSIALWLCWRGAEWYRLRALIRNEGQRISLIGAAILGAAVALSVVAGFYIAQREVEATVSDGLQQTLRSQINLFINNIEQRMVRAQTITNRPGAIAHLGSLNARPGDAAALNRLREVAESFLPLGFSAVAFLSPEGREWLRVGQFAGQPELSIRLNLPHPTHLLWDQGLVLNTRMPMTSGEVVGTVVAEQPLRSLTSAYGDVEEFGATGEVVVCAGWSERLHCFPQRLLPRVSSDPYSKRMPMSRAIAGQRGVVRDRDYRTQNVIAAYGPIGDLGLGMVVKMDTAELYAPMRQRFHNALLLLCTLVVGGTVLLYWRLKPLVGELERSRDLVREMGAQALRESEGRYRYLFEANPLPMWIVDAETLRFLAVNDAAVRAYGYTREEFLAMTTFNLRTPEDLPAYREYVGSRDAHANLQRRTRHRRKDGVVRDIEVTSHAFDFLDRPARLVLVNDVTDRLRAEEEVRKLNVELEQRVIDRTRELEAANKDLESFSYSISHDLRAPLRAVLGFSRLMTEDHAAQLDAEARRKLGVIQDEAHRMGLLIDDLLAFSRLGRKAIQMSEIDMTGLARATFQSLDGYGAAPKAELHLGALPRATGDRLLLGQVWVNLLANAVKFSSKRAQPVIEVSAISDDREHVYFVRDNGAGFDPRYRAKLFGVFERLHNSSDFPGTGVGLALVERIVTRHGGRVWADGKPDEGATFYFTLPKEQIHGTV